jgi:hypothetical protein
LAEGDSPEKLQSIRHKLLCKGGTSTAAFQLQICTKQIFNASLFKTFTEKMSHLFAYNTHTLFLKVKEGSIIKFIIYILVGANWLIISIKN